MATATEPTKTDGPAELVEETKGSPQSYDGLPPDVAQLFAEYAGAKEKKLLRKMDLHLIPIVSPARYFKLLVELN